ncbi:serine/threonine protein kinase [Oscillochloris trichoides DG-6]|uniref:non-specific serine/threonine protein kinase n=1 Tax=Oscillochloris trichoides DG-6 TaxID=765420 RepID=E1IBP6_9CHLR|nr:serine/threonine protein kinase [Oscillochloris trichoides DG-6]
MSTPVTSTRPERKPVGEPNASYEMRNYRLHERIGQEELATVYRANHLTLDRPVQVHILRRPDWISSSRFQLAARLAARLSHPNLLPVIDAGHDEKYGDYLVTPQTDGRPLVSMLAEGPLEVMLCLRVVAQVAAALDDLHQQQIFHRDVQPANILVTAQGVAYLANLSLAASPDTPDLSSIDEADYLTPYSAPEQRLAQGEAGAGLDVYSLGAVAYHMLSGQVPPAPGSPLPSLVARDPSLAPADRVLQRMLAVHPEARFPSAGAAASALRQALRSHIDLATTDMEESRWETSAEWLENPLETALGDQLDASFKDYLARSRKRADELHRRDVIRRHLNRWSRDGFFRRRALGQLVQPEQIVSYNIYFYELRTLYESRSAPETQTRPQKPDERPSMQPAPDVWSVEVPTTAAFESVAPKSILLPNSISIVSCTACGGVGQVPCKECNGKGSIEKERKVSNPDNKVKSETLIMPCPTCGISGKCTCPTCQGSGNLAKEQVFTYSRRAKEWQNSDDIEDLPQLAIKKRIESVYSATIDPYAGQWYSVAPLAEMLKNAIKDAGLDTRLLAAELKIRATTITEMDFLLEEKPRRIYLVGFDNELFGDWSLFNPERMALAGLAGFLTLLFMIVLLLAFL